MKKNTTIIITALLALLLAACGGGSGGGGTNNTDPINETHSYSIGVNVSGLTDNAELKLLNNGGNELTVTQNGGFAFTSKVAAGGSYNVTVLAHPAGQTCTVSSGTGTVSGSNVTGIVIVCSANPYEISVGGGATVGGAWSGANPDVFTPNVPMATVSATDIQSRLNAGISVTIATAQTSQGNGDISINSAISWPEGNLTLKAHRNININTAMNGSGTAGLTLEYGLGNVEANNTADYYVNASVNLTSTGSFSTKLGSDGAAKNYAIITDPGAAGSVTGTDLQGMQGNLTGNYVLGADINASATGGWNAGAGFAQIGTFTGILDGLGHTINGLTINRPGDGDDFTGVGLFGITEGATLRNIGLTNVNITGDFNVGGLVGYADSTRVLHSYATGAVNGTKYIGGLIGGHYISSRSVLIDSYAGVTVTATNPTMTFAGGLVGVVQRSQHNFDSADATISGSHATGNVSGVEFTGGLLGGFVYTMNPTVNDSYATGNVSGQDYTGGLIGGLYSANGVDDWGDMSPRPEGVIVSNSQATGAVSGRQEVGGLVGGDKLSSAFYEHLTFNYIHGSSALTVRNSHATGNVTGINQMGGLVGYIHDTLVISDSYATGNVTGTDGALIQDSDGTPLMSYIGGLAGGAIRATTVSDSHADGNVTGTGLWIGGLLGRIESGSSVTDSYASGNVTGIGDAGAKVGGLAGGLWHSTVNGSAATGDVNGSVDIGGLIGMVSSSTISDSYATGNVGGDAYIGGLIGTLGDSTAGGSSVTRAYATGAISGGTSGGLVGLSGSGHGYAVTVADSYWNTDVFTNGVGDSSGSGSTFLATGKNTVQMKIKTTYAGWDFTGKWKIVEGVSYPTLQ